MVSKKILSAVIASAFVAVPAFAAIDLNSNNPTKVKYAKEALTTEVTVADVKYYTVGDGAAADIDLTVDVGTGMQAAGAQRYARVDLGNAIFATAPTWTLANTAGSVVQGGAGKNYVIFEVTPSGVVAETDNAVIALADLNIAATLGAVSYTYAIYETQTGASTKTGPLNDGGKAVTLADAVSVVSGIKSTVESNTVTASVDNAFKKFLINGASATVANLGSFDVAADTAVADEAGAALTALAGVIDVAATKSKVVVKGDFSVGTWNMQSVAACDGTGTTQGFTLNSSKTEASIDIASIDAANAITEKYLCVSVNGTDVIPEATYTAAVDYVGITSAKVGPTDVTTGIGSIVRDGTTIHIPYVTTFADYAQRLVLVNRGGSDVAYSLTFTPETGVTVAPGAKATGTLKAKSTTIIPATELVTVTGATRTAATVTIVSSTGNIDAATTQVNLSDKSTDTVKLK